jgi:hypothetical protein
MPLEKSTGLRLLGDDIRQLLRDLEGSRALWSMPDLLSSFRFGLRRLTPPFRE